MKKIWQLMVVALMLFCLSAQGKAPKREFRGAWIQCVNGQYLGKGASEIRSMLSRQLDILAASHVNAIFFQVRAECDALYASRYEPWSRYLSGEQGRGMADGWDPLAWMIRECHARGMECHAWINPYRAKTKGTTALAQNHVAVRHPERVFQYGDLLILNPALEENRYYTCMVVEDILERYDVDGIHMDDYFYPYPAAGQTIPDANYFAQSPRGFKDIGDWRRDNVNQLIKELHALIKDVKPWVKFGISPFGIYRNDPSGKNTAYGSATRGLQNYDDLYADVLLWEREGWVDYLIPQVYWNFGTAAADYEVLCRWWNDRCGKRLLIIGEDVERTAKGVDPQSPNQNQTAAKYNLLARLKNVSGTCQWYAASFCENVGNYRGYLQSTYFKRPALQPKMTWKGKGKPGKVKQVRLRGNRLEWTAPKGTKWTKAAKWYAVYAVPAGSRLDHESADQLLTVTSANAVLIPQEYLGYTFYVSALNRLQDEGKAVKAK